MKTCLRPLFLSVATALGFTVTVAAFAQEQPAPTLEPVQTATTPVATENPSLPPADVGGPAAADLGKPTLRRLDAAPEAASPTSIKKTVRANKNSGGDPDRVTVFSENVIGAEEKVAGEAVAIMGDLRIDGEVRRDAVAVMGSVAINGKVGGEVVAVMGDVVLGPKAEVDGDVVAIGGTLQRDPGAIVGGEVTRVGVGKLSVAKLQTPAAMRAWWDHALGHGALFGFGAGLGWLAVPVLLALGFYALLALVFPGGIQRTGDLLVQRPGAVVLLALLTVMALPVLFILLLITVVGIPVALFGLPAGIVVGVGFGQAAIYGLVGRKLMQDRAPLAVSVLIGGIVFALLFAAPVVGLALAVLTAALGLGCSIAALLTAGKSPATPTLPVVPFAPPVVPATGAMGAAATAASGNGFTGPVGNETMAAPSPAPAPQSAGFGTAEQVPPMMNAAASSAAMPSPVITMTPNVTLPRAGFWIRAAALLIDLILIGVIFGPLSAGHLILPGLAAYGAVMWKYKGTTIGGIVCGLRVVRLDERPLDWPTTVVRALGCFLSLAVAGLGFVWVVFDSECQSWHDKIAGTVVVRARGTSLV
ncbi:MAG: hypothetical protein CK548_04580 [Opitutia bacterium]|nr:hypothetical protein [Opitutaceae bacterium]PHX72281.1 MAG: hypothetical protein CK548_04580 [Opitutae bacterium]